MAEETQTETSPEPATSLAKEVLVTEVPETPTEKEVLKEQPPPPPQAEKEHKRSDLETALAAEKAAEEEEKKVAEEEEKKAANVLKAAVSFKEESNLVGDLQDRERKALDEFKQLIQAAIANNEFSPPPPAPPSATAPADASTEVPKAEEAPKQPAEDSKVEETPEALVEETKAEETLKAPVEETAPAAEETSKQAVEEVKSEEEASKPAAEEAEPEEDASKAVVEEAEHEVEVSKPAEEEASKPAEEEAEVEADASKAAAVETKGEEEPPKPTAEETAPPSEEVKDATPSPPPVEAEMKSVVADDDGAKTVEAIEETVVPVAAAAPPPAETTPAEAEAPAKEEEEEKKEKPSSEAPAVAAEPPEEVFIWGVPLLGDERSDTILLKFLRARDFKVKEAMIMLKNAVLWRKEFGIEALLAEDLGVKELEKVVFMQGSDREGHPVCYNVYGELQNKELYALAFADEEKRRRFLRWRIQFLERGIRDLLDLSPGGVSSMVQVTDLKNSIWLAKKELRQALDLLQDNYPEFSAKQIFINVPWWYLAFNRMISPFFTQRTKSKFVFAGPSRSAETLFKYIAPEQVPVQYGGLSKENDPEFTIADAVTEISIKPSTKQNIEIPVSEPCLPFWELRVLGSDVTVGAEFVPSAEDGYTIIVQKARKLSPTDEPVVKGSYKVGEAGKVILTVDNTTSKKKKLLYRYKIKASTESV